MIDNPAIRPVLVKKLRKIIDQEELAAMKTAIAIIEEVTDSLCFDRADVYRKELHRVADMMQNTVDDIELGNINPCFNFDMADYAAEVCGMKGR